MTRVPLTLEDGRRLVLIREQDELRILGADRLTPDELATLRATREVWLGLTDLVASLGALSTSEVHSSRTNPTPTSTRSDSHTQLQLQPQAQSTERTNETK